MGGHELVALFVFLCLLSIPFATEARIRHYRWEVKYEYKSPDCYKKLATTIDEQTPGPTIEAQVNDTVVVKFKNSLVIENVVIHWHGIRQSLLINGKGWFNCSTPGLQAGLCNVTIPNALDLPMS